MWEKSQGGRGTNGGLTMSSLDSTYIKRPLITSSDLSLLRQVTDLYFPYVGNTSPFSKAEIKTTDKYYV